MSRIESFEGIAVARAEDWVGRREERWGVLTSELASMLDAAIGHDLSADRDLCQGAYLPCLWHWAAFPEFVPMSELGNDGHPRLGSFLPPLALPRRMWAGGKLTFSGGLRIGERLRKRSEILSVTEKRGATGQMVFVRVGHVIEGENSSYIEEVQDIVYLNIPEKFNPPKKVEVPGNLSFDETVPINEARLFRYSAATFNAHRIHYDLPYTRDVEKYPALVVHGPMQATMAIEAAKRHTGQVARQFRFRVVHPMFHDQDMRLVGRLLPGRQSIELGTASPDGHLGLQASMEWN